MGLHGEEHWARRPLASVEEDPRRDDVPGLLGDDVAGEEVNMLGGVLPAVVVGSELTAVSGVDAVTGGLNLNSDDAGAEIEGDVEGLGVSPGLEDRETAAEGFGYELGFDPFAAFFEVPELGHAAPKAIAEPRFGCKRKGAAHGPRLVFLNFYSIYSV